MLGNDVVDLRDRDARPETFRARFDERVFSADERRAIAHDPNPLARRWAHWGAKEAAFKLAKQIDPTFVFSPSTLIANFVSVTRVPSQTPAAFDGDQTLVSDDRGTIERRGRLALPSRTGEPIGHTLPIVELRSVETSDYVHVVAVPAGADWGGVDSSIERLDSETSDASAAVRAMAIQEISRGLGVGAERISIGSRGRIPTIELDGSRTSLSISLSHHGRFIGYAMSLNHEPRSFSGWNGPAKDATGAEARLTWQ
jgi:hypothetical protein